MEITALPLKLNKQLQGFLQELKRSYRDELLSVILYGSAASGEFVPQNSDLNILVALNSAAPEELRKGSAAVNRYPQIRPLFLTKDYIRRSVDVFPVEFMDMQENYRVLYGQDLLKDVQIDPKNLRFQCEQELKIKLLNLQQLYLRSYARPQDLLQPLLKSFTAILHVLRSWLRAKGSKPAYRKEELVGELAQNFEIDKGSWEKILSAKQNKTKLNKAQIESLFCVLLKDLEKISRNVDAF